MRPRHSTRLLPVTCALIVLVLLPSPLVLSDISVDWDRKVAFPGRVTFSMAEGTPLSNPLASLRIEQALSAMLVEKGLREDPAPDLLVIVHASVEPSRSLNLGAYQQNDGIWETEVHTIQSIDAGTLLVDLLEASTHRLIWRGMATDTVTNNPSRNQKPVPKALRRMFRKFPPPVAKQAKG